ncbi:MAG: MopE-related protein [Myxococcota bacterium]
MLVILLAACHDGPPGVGGGSCKGVKCKPHDSGPRLVDDDGDGCAAERDCDDGDPERCEDLEEACDGIDNDCDDEVDEEGSLTQFADADGDGYGDANTFIVACPREGFVTDRTDCDDADAAIHPSAEEICNEIDDDCDDLVDEGVTGLFFADGDGDGFGDAASTTSRCAEGDGWVADDTDCDDADPDEPVVVRDGESIQAALEVAEVCVYVYEGDYGEDLDFGGKEILVRGVDGADLTVVTGTGAGPVVRFASGEGSAATLTGFTITGGAGEDDGAGVTRGGGLYVHRASPTVSNLVVRGNTASEGGGIALFDAAMPVAEGLTVVGNDADVGGGVYVGAETTADLAEVRIEDNTASVGAAIASYGLTSLDHVLVAGNVGGPALETSGSGGAIFARHVTWASNGDVPVRATDGAVVAIVASLLWGDPGAPCLDGDPSAALSLTYSDIYGCAAPELGPWGPFTGAGATISAACPFVDDAAGDYRLVAGTPCEDTVPGAEEEDCEGTPGDMGAFEGVSGCW